MATFPIERLTRIGAKASTPITCLETASQTFKRGQLVTRDSNGYVHATADNGVGTLGIALADASGVTAAKILIDPILPGELLQITIYNATKASAVLAEANVGLLFPVVTVSNVTMLNNATNASPLFRIVARSENNTATDVYPKAIVTVIPGTLQTTDCTQI